MWVILVEEKQVFQINLINSFKKRLKLAMLFNVKISQFADTTGRAKETGDAIRKNYWVMKQMKYIYIYIYIYIYTYIYAYIYIIYI